MRLKTRYKHDQIEVLSQYTDDDKFVFASWQNP